ncbi:pilus assembly PilX family protein [Dyella acidiphila]|uniref:Type 4 fimbrial biogenesis protein PilX N-terminal domain-containing protein n=1 Tax=Dyella acidiphila TaxID=2775866 RepID=A0ABR9G7R0_9GAMM|nr:PilX N-terminal domain-containing pilus assembly protein [Dyella acidiphila]MBE1160073.1 hypothetical protein [Dyella acidiphila]
MNTLPQTAHRKEDGFVLIAALLMLVVMTFMAVSLYHNFTVQENMSANTKEKGRAFQMAMSTLQYAEYQVLQSGLNTGVATTCSGPPNGDVFTICPYDPTNASNSQMQLVSASQGTPMQITNGMTYNLTTDDSSVQFATSGGAGLYYKQPQYFVSWLGYDPKSTCQAKIYQITALGYGGTGGAVAVVQSNYELTPTVCNLGNA